YNVFRGRQVIDGDQLLSHSNNGEEERRVIVEQDVHGLDIAMDDLDCVCGCEATAEGDHVVQRRLRCQAVAYALFQIPSVYVLHRYIMQASVTDANVVDGHNMAMTHGGEHAAFIQKAL